MMLRIDFQSEETWTKTHDLLRGNPRFYGRPCYDCVLFKAASRNGSTLCFGRLKGIFVYQLTSQTKVPFALVEVYDVVQGRRSQLDQDLGLCRVRGRLDAYAGTVFIHVEAIVRGALLVSDRLEPGQALGEGGEPFDIGDDEDDEGQEQEQGLGTDGDDKDDDSEDESEDEEEEDLVGPRHNDLFVVDMVDGDMFLRCRKYFDIWDT